VDANDPAMVQPLYDAALNVKEQIYGGWVYLCCCVMCMYAWTRADV
jgi:hypothetical protein